METDLLALWKSVQNDLKRFVYSKVRDRAVVDDIMHDVFLKVQAKIDSVRDRAKIKSWVYTVTHRTVMDHFRNQARQVDPGFVSSENEDPNFNECVTNYMQKLIPRLPYKYKEAIQLTELGSMSQFALAGHLGISVSGAKSRVQRARALLRKMLEKDLILQTDNYGNVLLCECRTPSCC